MEEQHHKIAEFYDHVYYRNACPGIGTSGDSIALARRLGITPGTQLLDIACGTGEWLRCAKDFGAQISGIDISEKAISVCRQGLPDGDFHIGVAETLPFADNQFDLVTCLGSLEHFVDQPAALKEMHRVVKPNGKLLILVPNAGFLTYRLNLFRGTHQQSVRETIRSLDEWERMFWQADLHVDTKWKDLHILSRAWIFRPPWLMAIPRLLQGLALLVWPLNWQYQVHHLCSPTHKSRA